MQPTPAELAGRQLFDQQVYIPLLNMRMRKGMNLMDALCHQQENEPQALVLFHQVMHLDAFLAQLDARYEQDYQTVVCVREDARYHRPGLTIPDDHGVHPCAFCDPDSLQHVGQVVTRLPKRSAA